jgi:plasmid stabilization system protein ParE
MSPYILSPAAQADIDAIWDYTADNWSIAQADLYFVFRIVDGYVDVIRILHQRMDIGSHLQD